MGLLKKRLSGHYCASTTGNIHALLRAGVFAVCCLLVSCDSLNTEEREEILLYFEGVVYAADDSTGIGAAMVDLQQWQFGVQFLIVQRAMTDYRGRYTLVYPHRYYPSKGARMNDLILTATAAGYYQGRVGMYPEPSLQFSEEIQIYDFHLTRFP